MKSKLGKITFLLLFASSTSWAAIRVEPLLGYRLFGGVNSQTPDGDDRFRETESDYSGPVFGVKVGYPLPLPLFGFVVGADVRLGSVTTKLDLERSLKTTDLKTTDIGVFVGFTTLPLLNFWLSYFFSSEWEKEEEEVGRAEGSFSGWGGKGIGLGAGFTAFPFISFNVEYNKYTFDNETPSASGSDILLSVSLPLSL